MSQRKRMKIIDTFGKAPYPNMANIDNKKITYEKIVTKIRGKPVMFCGLLV